jgi:protein subunit release factor A
MSSYIAQLKSNIDASESKLEHKIIVLKESIVDKEEVKQLKQNLKELDSIKNDILNDINIVHIKQKSMQSDIKKDITDIDTRVKRLQEELKKDLHKLLKH